MFISFNLRKEYFQYFASKEITQETLFIVDEVRKGPFFTEKITLKRYSENFLAKFTSPKLLWKSQNYKGLERNDVIQFTKPLKLKDLNWRDLHIMQSKRMFQSIENNSFEIIKSKPSLIQKIQKKIKRFYRKHLKEDNANVAIGLVLGGRNANIKQVDINNIRNLGLGHFFSASGFHLLVLLLIIMWITKRTSFLLKLQTPIAMSFCLFYMTLTNFSPSIIRAGVLAIAFLLFQHSSRVLNSKKLLVFLAAILLLLDPYTAFDIGFQLSYLASFAILFFYKDIHAKLSQVISLDWLLDIVSVSLSVQILVLPVVIFYFSNLQLWSLLANIIFTPILSLITILCFTGLYFILDPLLSLIRWLFNLSVNLPYIDLRTDLDFTSTVMLWIILVCTSLLMLKSFDKDENFVLNFFKAKEIQLCLLASAFLILIATNLKPFNVTELAIKKGLVTNKVDKELFDIEPAYKYFEIAGKKALLINRLETIKDIEDDIHEVNFLFIPKITTQTLYLRPLIKLLEPQITIIDTKSESPIVLDNIRGIGNITNTIFGSGRIFISQNKFWAIRN